VNKKDTKKKEIMEILINNNKPFKIREFSSQLGVSEKSVRNYLDEIEEFMSDNHTKLIRKPSVGIYLEIDEENRALLKRKLNININKMYSSQYRQEYILKILFKNRYTYTIQLLADDLQCSKNTIVNDLVYAEKWLINHKISLKRKPNQGLWIEGVERDIRDAMMSLFLEIGEDDINDSVDNDEINNLDYRINITNYNKIKQLFPRLNICKIQKIIQQSEIKLGYFFTDQAFINLIAHIAITIERSKFNKKIKVQKNNFEDLKINKEYEIAKWVVGELSKEFKLKIHEDEIAYISLHMLGAKIQEDVSLGNYNVILSSNKESDVQFAREIIAFIGDILGVCLAGDELLLVSLVIHLRPTIIRLKYNLQLRNPLLQRIKDEYRSIFGAAWACSNIFEERFGVIINEDEVAFIALHVAVAVERLKGKVKTIVVCSSGIGTSQMVAGRLKKKFDDVEIVGVIPMNNLNKRIIDEVDLIISTVPLREKNEKVVYVSTLVDESDMFNIRNKINIVKANNDIYSNMNESQLEIGNLNLEKVLSIDFCFIDEGKMPYLKIVEEYATRIEEGGFVKNGFCGDILEREQKSSTTIGNGIAIPHSKREFIEKSKICIIKLDNPVKWNEEDISLILILALKFEDVNTTTQFFKNFYSILDNSSIIEKIKNSKKREEIVSLLLTGVAIT